MNTPQPTAWKYLAPNPRSYLRQLFVKGTKLRAWTLYLQFIDDEEPMTPEEIAADYGVPVDAVREAIAYCESDPPEFDLDFADEEAWFAARKWNEFGALVLEKPNTGSSDKDGKKSP